MKTDCFIQICVLHFFTPNHVENELCSSLLTPIPMRLAINRDNVFIPQKQAPHLQEVQFSVIF